MNHCEALIIGGSAGSLNVIIKILPELRTDIDFPIVIVIHRKSGYDSLLTELLSEKTEMRVKELEEKEPMMPATIYIAPPDYHTLIEKDRTFSLDASEKINFSRPAIDVTFESASEVFREKLACLLLSGANSDGTEGLKVVKENGGLVIIQDPETAVVEFMPMSAINAVETEYILSVDEISNFINKL